MPALNLLDLRLAALFTQNIIKQSPVNSVLPTGLQEL